ncbi:ribosomal protein L7/L12 [Kitasatospora sp. NPDC093679]|uniref:ribosomal protein L7/L12 n=1 Tax=Kitasatospora sp. NPDC093679 TaxID=3154983 RepID=UPI0034427DF5
MHLTEAGDRGIEVVKAVRAVTGASLWRSRQLVDGAPVGLVAEAALERAVAAAARLRAAGAGAEIRCGWCRRTLPATARRWTRGRARPCTGPRRTAGPTPWRSATAPGARSTGRRASPARGPAGRSDGVRGSRRAPGGGRGGRRGRRPWRRR